VERVDSVYAAGSVLVVSTGGRAAVESYRSLTSCLQTA